MLTIPDRTQAMHRRDLLQIGGVGALGLALPQLLAARQSDQDRTFGKAKNLIFLFMAGGPSQYETFDPKPDAPAEIRGVFQPIATNVPGVRICELLPRIARIADKLCIVRSLATDDPNHESGGYWVNTGYKYTGPNMRSVNPTDWPSLASVIKRLKPSTTVPFSSVVLPEPIVANPNVFLPGQNGGFLGTRWDPEFLRCDPSAPGFKIEGFAPPDDVPTLRLSGRRGLAEQFDRQARWLDQHASVLDHDRTIRDALSVILSSKARQAFELERESATLRERYGRGKWGQSVLLARRLIEAGVRMVFVNWPREPGDLSSSNPLWDTHAQNNPRMKDVLCPPFDLGFTALIDDLGQRGLLDETLVVAIGEMGRTPKFNSAGGRDHWGNVFSFVLAGAGIRTAQVVGSSDKNGAYPLEGRVTPSDLTATIFHLLGIGAGAMFPDKFNRPHKVTEGEPIRAVLGHGPATHERTTPGGIVPATVAPAGLLVDGDFKPPAKLHAPGTSERGWQADPITVPTDHFTVLLARVPGPRSRSGEHHVGIGYGLQTGNGQGKIAQGTRALLAQEIHNPRPGKYTFTIHASGGAFDRPDYYRDVWLKHFTCKLVIFGYQNDRKDPREMTVFASQTFTPPFAGPYEANYRPYSVSAVLKDQDGGGQIRNGIGIAVIVEKTSPGVLDVATGGPRSQGLIRVDDGVVEFAA